MTQTAVVKRLLEDGLAEVEVQRQSACGHDCASCGGCGAKLNRLTTQAINRAGAQIGDVVTIAGDTKEVFGIAAIVYAVPFLLFFTLYGLLALAGQGEGMCAAGGILGFVLGILGAIGYNQRVRVRGVTPYVIVRLEQSAP